MTSFSAKCACCGLVLLGVAAAIEHESICPRDAYCKALPPELTHGPHDQHRPGGPQQIRQLVVAASTASAPDSTGFIFRPGAR
jgi:hypothetical protein